MFYTELDGDANSALISSNRKSAVAKARAHIAHGGTAVVHIEKDGIRLPDADAARMLSTPRVHSNGAYTPDYALHNALEKLAILCHTSAQSVLKRAMSEETISGIYESCNEVQGLLSE